jgi:predicted exporter
MLGRACTICWFVLLLGLCSLTVYAVRHHWRIQTDILALLPKDDRDATVRALRRLVSDTFGRRTLVLVSHAQPAIAREVTRQLAHMLEASELFTDVQWEYRHQHQAFFDFYFPRRYQVLSPLLRQYLEHEDGYTHLIARLERALYQPTSAFLTTFLDKDPLLFFPALLQSWQQAAAQLRLDDGMLGRQWAGKYHVLITAKLALNPFASEPQTRLEASWQTWITTLRRTAPALDITHVSMARFAASARQQMQRDILLISIGSMLGILCVVVGTFRAVTHLVLALVPLAIGLWCALGLSLLLFGELHALTLVFGASLIGIYIDYSFHYFAHHRMTPQWQPQQAMRALIPALSLGALTTLLSYAGLGVTPLVGLQQIAVFASCGLLVSFATVVLGTPWFLSKPHPRAEAPPLLYRGAQRVLHLWYRRKFLVYALIVVLGIVSVQGMRALQVDDSPQAFSTPAAHLVTQAETIRRIMGASHTQRYLVVEGKTTEETLQRLEAFHRRIRAEHDQLGVRWGPILTSFVPSLKQQQDDAQAVKRLLQSEAEITHALHALGFPPQPITEFFRVLAQPLETFIVPETWRQHRVSLGLRDFWLGETAAGAAVWVPIQELTDAMRLHTALTDFPGIRYVDHVADFTRVLAHYRQRAIRLVGLAYVVIALVLLWRYRLQGLVVILPPVLAACLTLGMLGLLGQAVNLMHCLALLFILGMGVDYTIFLRESAAASEPTVLLALTLSAITTALSFGLLSLSSQAMLRAIGLTTLLGICCAWLLAPLATTRRQSV